MGRRIIAILMLALTVALATVPSFADEAVSLTELDLTTIEEDFAGANFDTEKFISNLEDPTIPEVAICREYWQRFKVSNPITWLYVYVYVPYGVEGGYDTLADVVEIYLGTSFDENGRLQSMSKFTSEIVDRTDDGKFYKCKVDATGVYKMIDSKRVYSVGAVQFRVGGEALGYRSFMKDKDYRNYLFTGSDLNGDLNVEFEYEKVLDLDTVLQRYRTESSSYGVGWRNDVFYVYFSVPNTYFEKYDDLTGVEYKYWEEMVNGFGCSNDEVFGYAKELMNYGTLPDTFDEDLPIILARLISSSQSVPSCDFAINKDVQNYNAYSPQEVYCLSNVVFLEDWKADGEIFDLEDLPYSLGYAQSGTNSEYGWNYKTAKPEEVVSVQSMYGGEDGFTKWWANWILGLSDNVIDDVDMSNKCIVKVDDYFFNGFDAPASWSIQNFVEVNDMVDVRKFYDEAVAADRTMYIMRFPETRDYYSYKSVLYLKGGYNSFFMDENGFYFQGTSITDFNIISLYFNKAGISYKIFVNDKVQNFPFDGEGGQDDDGDNLEEAVKQGLSGIGDYLKGLGDKTSDLVEQLKEILKVVAIVIGCILLLTLVSFVLPLIVPLIGALFRAIGGAFKRLFKRNNNRKDE